MAATTLTMADKLATINKNHPIILCLKGGAPTYGRIREAGLDYVIFSPDQLHEATGLVPMEDDEEMLMTIEITAIAYIVTPPTILLVK